VATLPELDLAVAGRAAAAPAPGSSIADISEIILTPPALVMRGLVYAMAALVGVALLWAYFGQYDVIVDAPGQLTTAQPPGVIQAASVARVVRVLVLDGTPVSAGQPVVEVTGALGAAPDQTPGAGGAAAPPAAIELEAPIAGVISGLGTLQPGELVTPGQQLAQVAPAGGHWIAAIQIANQDMGSVHIGRPVQVKIDAFPFQQYGTLRGRLASIAAIPAAAPAGTGPAPAGPPGYTAIVAFDPDDRLLERLSREGRLRPGLTLTAEIEVNRRRILSMLFNRM
jgi:multidrug efflux pump subunit AcrA (membrane-fusion protein)